MAETAQLVVTVYRIPGSWNRMHYRLHRFDCPVLRPTTRVQSYQPRMQISRVCERCKPVLPVAEA